MAHGEIGWGQLSEIGGIGEEVPGSGGRDGEDLRLVERVKGHGKLTSEGGGGILNLRAEVWRKSRGSGFRI